MCIRDRYNAVGDQGTGTTSAGKPGFYSNNSDQTKVSYQIEGEKGTKTASYEKPVVQVTTHTLSYEKKWNHPDNVETPNQDVILKVTYTNGEEKEIILELFFTSHRRKGTSILQLNCLISPSTVMRHIKGRLPLGFSLPFFT